MLLHWTGVELPTFVPDVFSLDPKNPDGYIFIEKYLQVHAETLLCELRESNTDGKKICARESSLKLHAGNESETLPYRGINKVLERLKTSSCTN